MARRYNRKELEEQGQVSNETPLTGIVKLQPNRTKGKESWRPPTQTNNLSELDVNCNSEFDVSDFSSLTGSFNSQLQFEWRPQSAQPSRLSASPFNLPQRKSSENVGASPMSQHREITVSPNKQGVEDAHTRVFGKLPDPIRLHEQMGEFDGQVVFIGHPNRDVSAHQWSLGSFQWINIGRYSFNRGKLNGSLASDFLQADISSESAEYFKLAAENREKQVKTHGWPTEKRNYSDKRQVLTEDTQLASLSSDSSSMGNPFSGLTGVDEPRTAKVEEEQMGKRLASGNVTREYLEDPFITPAKNDIVPVNASTKDNSILGAGSMDFSYEFPMKSTTTAVVSPRTFDDKSQQVYLERKRAMLPKVRAGGETQAEQETSSSLQEVKFGEEASSSFTPAKHNALGRPPVSCSPEIMHYRRQLQDRSTELGDKTLLNRPSHDHHRRDRVAVPHLPALQPTLESLRPPPGLTVANPRGINSTLNANAPPYTFIPYTQRVDSPDSDMTTVNAHRTANLRYSDPDGTRQKAVYDIANGVSQEPPTRQTFKGPFFADSMPTAHDLTASLSVHISADKELNNWYRDGQRPDRQREYAKTLISTAAATNRARSYGAIGEGSMKKQDLSKYENTGLFVRLYENLSENVDETRKGDGRSYFTRAWKQPPPHLCDPSRDGNDSFFGQKESIEMHITPMRRPPELPSHAWSNFATPINSSPAGFSRAHVANGRLRSFGPGRN